MKRIWEVRKFEILTGVGIFVFALFLRIYNLTIIPIFGDEAIYIRWSQVMRAEQTLRFLPLSDGKQPLFMWIVIPFIKTFSDPLIAGRIISVFSGLGTLVGIFVLTQLLFRTKKVSLFAGLIYTISPFSIFFDRLALADSMLSMFGVWTLIFAIITIRKARLDSAMIAGFSLGGALLTKTPATFFAVLLPTSLMLLRGSSFAPFLLTFTYAIGYAMYNILRLGPNFHMIGLRNKDYVYPITHILERPFDPLLPFLKEALGYFWLLGPSVLILLILIGIYVGLKKYRKETLLLIAWGIIPIFAVAEFSKTMTARYIYFSMPYLFVVASLSYSFFVKNIGGVKLIHLPGGLGSHLRGLVKLILVALLMHAFFIDYQLLNDPQKVSLPRSERSGYLEEWTSGYGIREVSDIIRLNYLQNPTRKFVVGTEGYFGTLPDGLQMYLNNYPEITVIGVGLDLKEVPKPLVESEISGNNTYLVINSSRLKADPDKIGLELLAAYPKAVRPNGSRGILYLFEVTKEVIVDEN